MASGDLFRAFTVRFSFKKRQHVQMLQKFEDRQLTDAKSKNQVVMDALEMYFDALENNRETKEEKWITKEFFEQRLEQFKQEVKEEIWRELISILVGSRMAGQPFMAVSSSGEPFATPVSTLVSTMRLSAPITIWRISKSPRTLRRLPEKRLCWIWKATLPKSLRAFTMCWL